MSGAWLVTTQVAREGAGGEGLGEDRCARGEAEREAVPSEVRGEASSCRRPPGGPHGVIFPPHPRWNYFLNPNVRKGVWHPDEDAAIRQWQRALGNKWAKIAGFLPGRCVPQKAAPPCAEQRSPGDYPWCHQ
jgi:hypothetical protein